MIEELEALNGLCRDYGVCVDLSHYSNIYINENCVILQTYSSTIVKICVDDEYEN